MQCSLHSTAALSQAGMALEWASSELILPLRRIILVLLKEVRHVRP